MVFSSEDQILIEQLYHSKGYGARKLVKEFPEKGWKVCSMGRLLKKLKDTGTTSRQAGSGRPQTARTPENINVVGDMICSQENAGDWNVQDWKMTDHQKTGGGWNLQD